MTSLLETGTPRGSNHHNLQEQTAILLEQVKKFDQLQDLEQQLEKQVLQESSMMYLCGISKTATNSKHNRGNATSSSEANTVNWDHFYTRGRSETIMDDGLPYDENASVMSAEERADVTEKLRAKREERRQNDPRFKNTGSGIGGSTKGKDKVDFNANKNDKKDMHVKEEKSGCTIS
eukprot:gene23180-29374_t